MSSRGNAFACSVADFVFGFGETVRHKGSGIEIPTSDAPYALARGLSRIQYRW